MSIASGPLHIDNRDLLPGNGRGCRRTRHICRGGARARGEVEAEGDSLAQIEPKGGQLNHASPQITAGRTYPLKESFLVTIATATL